jgi:hypothetical protein
MGGDATVSATLTYKSLFDSLAKCANWADIKATQTDYTSKDTKTQYSTNDIACSSSWDATTFHAVGDTGHKDQKPVIYHWDYTWSTVSTGGWCYQRTVLPSKWKGGLIMTHANA